MVKSDFSFQGKSLAVSLNPAHIETLLADRNADLSYRKLFVFNHVTRTDGRQRQRMTTDSAQQDLLSAHITEW